MRGRSNGWINEVNSRPVIGVAQALGLVHGNRLVCPLCHKADSGVRIDSGNPQRWKCWHNNTCSAPGGSSLDLAAYRLMGDLPAKGDKDAWSRLRELCAGHGLCSPPEGYTGTIVPLRPFKATAPSPETSKPDQLPAGELERFWARCSPLELAAGVVEPWLQEKGLPSRILDLEDVRLLRPESLVGSEWERHPPRWLPSSLLDTSNRRPAGPVLVFKGHNHSGEWCSLNFRVLSPEPGQPKELRPRGISARQAMMSPALLAGLDAGESMSVVIAEGGTDWLLWRALRPDLPILGIWNGSPFHELMGSIPAGSSVIIRTDRDKAGDGYASRLRKGAGHLWLTMWRAQPQLSIDGEDDGDLYRAGLLTVGADPVSDCERFQPGAPTPIATRVSEPWRAGEVLSLEEMGDQLAQWLAEAMDTVAPGTFRLINTPVGTSKSEGTEKALAGLGVDGQTRWSDGVTLLLVENRNQVVKLTKALRIRGIRTEALIGKGGPLMDHSWQLWRPGPADDGDHRSCGNERVRAQIQSDHRRDLCKKCPLADRCRPADITDTLELGTYGQVDQIKRMPAGVVVTTHAMSPNAIKAIGKSLSRIVVDEVPQPEQHVLSMDDVDALKTAGMLRLATVLHDVLTAASRSHIEQDDDNMPAILKPEAALSAMVDASLQDWKSAEQERILRVGAAMVLSALASTPDEVEAVGRLRYSHHTDGEGQWREGPALVYLASTDFPADVPIIGLDATARPNLWAAYIGRNPQMVQATLKPHHNLRAVLVESHAFKSGRTEKTASALRRRHQDKAMDKIRPALAELASTQETPRAVIFGWQKQIDAEDFEPMTSHLADAGFEVTVAHHLGPDCRGTNQHLGAAVIITAGTPTINGLAALLQARWVARRTGQDEPTAIPWDEAHRAGLTWLEQEHGRARSLTDPNQQPTLHVHLGDPQHWPGLLVDLHNQGQGLRFKPPRPNNTCRAWLEHVASMPGVHGVCAAVLADPDRSPVLDELGQRPHRKTIEQNIPTAFPTWEKVKRPRPGGGRPEVWFLSPGHYAEDIPSILNALSADSHNCIETPDILFGVVSLLGNSQTTPNEIPPLVESPPSEEPLSAEADVEPLPLSVGVPLDRPAFGSAGEVAHRLGLFGQPGPSWGRRDGITVPGGLRRYQHVLLTGPHNPFFTPQSPARVLDVDAAKRPGMVRVETLQEHHELWTPARDLASFPLLQGNLERMSASQAFGQAGNRDRVSRVCWWLEQWGEQFTNTIELYRSGALVPLGSEQLSGAFAVHLEDRQPSLLARYGLNHARGPLEALPAGYGLLSPAAGRMLRRHAPPGRLVVTDSAGWLGAVREFASEPSSSVAVVSADTPSALEALQWFADRAEHVSIAGHIQWQETARVVLGDGLEVLHPTASPYALTGHGADLMHLAYLEQPGLSAVL